MRAEERGGDASVEERPPGFSRLGRRVEEERHLGTPSGDQLIGRPLEGRMGVGVVAEDAAARGKHPAEDPRQPRFEVGEHLPVQGDSRQAGEGDRVEFHGEGEGVHQHPCGAEHDGGRDEPADPRPRRHRRQTERREQRQEDERGAQYARRVEEAPFRVRDRLEPHRD